MDTKGLPIVAILVACVLILAYATNGFSFDWPSGSGDDRTICEIAPPACGDR